MEVKNGFMGSCSGSFVALLLQPLQNIKMVLILPPRDVHLTNNFVTNIQIACNYLAQQKPLASFYKGLVPNLVKTGFSSGIYFSCLRSLEDSSRQCNKALNNNPLLSFMNSLLARVTSAFCVNPLSVVETRFQFAGKQRWSGGVLGSLIKIQQEEGLRGYFKGALASCYKQGAFAGLYYMFLRKAKSLGFQTMTAGIIAGIISTLITHPFEIVRAELQAAQLMSTSNEKVSIIGSILNLMRSGELLKGVAPRLIKKPLTNTLAFVMFESMEKEREKEKSQN